jgi:hypothetical protein
MMNFSPLIILLLSISVFAALMTLYFSCRTPFRWRSALAVVLSCATLATVVFSIYQRTYISKFAGNHPGIPHNIGKGRIALIGKAQDSKPPLFDLSTSSGTLEEFFARWKNHMGWIILDGSRGLHPTHHSWFKKNGVSVHSLQHEQVASKKRICWVRSKPFPFSSGSCSFRNAAVFFDGEGTSLAQDSHGRNLAFHFADTAHHVVALGFSQGAEEPSPEELCLQGLVNGQTCVALEIFPGAAREALTLIPTNGEQASVLAEFGVPFYSIDGKEQENDVLLPTELEEFSVTEESAACAGTEETHRIAIRDLKKTTERLSVATSEAGLSQILETLSHKIPCAEISRLILPPLKLRDPRAGLRSFLTQLLEQPLWLTSPEGFAERKRFISEVILSADSAHQIWLTPPERLKDVSLTFVAPYSFSDLSLKGISVHADAKQFRFFRLSPQSARIALEGLNSSARLSFESIVAQRLDRNPFDSFHDSGNFVEALLASFTIALIASIVQTLCASSAEGQKPFWPATSLPIFAVSFTLIWLSLRAASRTEREDMAVASVGVVGQGQHIFLQEWPEAWFPAALPRNVTQFQGEAEQLSPHQWSVWSETLKAAQAFAAQSKPKNETVTVDISRIPKAHFAAKGRIVLWSSSQARNAFFRKSTAYDAAVTAWKGFLAQSQFDTEFVDDSSLVTQLNAKTNILIVPDARFIRNPIAEHVLQWITKGGKIIFSEFPEAVPLPPAMTEQTKQSASLTALLKQAGLGRSIGAKYSSVQFEDQLTYEIKAPHRLISSSARNARTSSWFGSSLHGAGAAYFLGIVPTDSVSVGAVKKLMNSLLGESQTVPRLASGCTTALLLEPYGASEATLKAFSHALKQRGMTINWLLDAESFAGMIPNFYQEFSSHNVVFLDHGKAPQRMEAEFIWQAFQKNKLPLTFATTGIIPHHAVQGPRASLTRAHLLPPFESAHKDLLNWRKECAYGVAEARLIPGSDLDKNAQRWINELSKVGRGNLTTLSQVTRALERLSAVKPERLAKGDIPVLKVRSPLHNPFGKETIVQGPL